MRIPEIVIIGGGFGGLYAARGLRKLKVKVTLIDRRNFHLFQPLLYQVATGALSPANIAAPLRAILKRQKNVRVVLGEVQQIDVASRCVSLQDGESIAYDMLVVATGVRHQYFGHPEWESIAPGLKTIEDATAIRRRILLAFERAERTSDVAEKRKLLTFVVIGGGPTGVEMAGAINELAKQTLRRDFRQIDPAHARIILIDGVDRVLPTFPGDLSAKAAESLRRIGVEVWTKATVIAVQSGRVTVQRQDSATSPVEHIDAETIIWSAGVQASPLGKVLADATGAEVDRAGRIVVQSDLTIAGHPEIFVIGDLAVCKGEDGKTLPGVAPVAIQQGEYVAKRIGRQLSGETSQPFRMRDRGRMATIGRASAVAIIFGMHLSGFVAWLAWLFIHLMYLVAFENRLLVLMQWGWNYFTRNRSSRLITGEANPLDETRESHDNQRCQTHLPR